MVFTFLCCPISTTANNSATSEVIIDPPPDCVPGDADASGAVDIDDAVFLIEYIFASGPAPDQLCCGDENGSGNVDIDDVVYAVMMIFSGGAAAVPDACENWPG